ncbi:uncharacterized protein LOC128929630 [Callithrix jacchus]
MLEEDMNVLGPKERTLYSWQKEPVQKKILSVPLDKGLNGLSASELHLIVTWVQPMAGIHTAHRRSVGPWDVAMSLCLDVPENVLGTTRSWDLKRSLWMHGLRTARLHHLEDPVLRFTESGWQNIKGNIGKL